MKKTVSLILAILICIGMMPVSVFSEDEVITAPGTEISALAQSETGEEALSSEAPETKLPDSTAADNLNAPDYAHAPKTTPDSDPSEPELLDFDEFDEFDLEENYAYYLTLEPEEAELYLASLSEDHRFILLDYIEAMNEIAELEAEIEAEMEVLEPEVLELEVLELEELEQEAGEQENENLDSSDVLDSLVEENEGLDIEEPESEEETLEQNNESREESAEEDTETQTIEAMPENAENDEDAENADNEDNNDNQESETIESQIQPSTFESEPVSGNCGANGSNVKWSFNTSTGLLSLTGTGAMADYSYTLEDSTYKTTAPWVAYSNSISSVSVSSGITSIGNYAFYRLSALSSITIPEGVTTIGKYAFYKSIGLTAVSLPSSLISIGNNALTEVTQITFAGTKDEWKAIG